MINLAPELGAYRVSTKSVTNFLRNWISPSWDNIFQIGQFSHKLHYFYFPLKKIPYKKSVWAQISNFLKMVVFAKKWRPNLLRVPYTHRIDRENNQFQIMQKIFTGLENAFVGTGWSWKPHKSKEHIFYIEIIFKK